jgi:carboxymethylenebutenolidase
MTQDFRLARRGFVMGSLITGFTLATARADAAPIATDARGLEAGEQQIPVADGHLPAYVARPAGAGPFPTVLVIEEIFGVHEYIKDICRRLAKAGYCAVAPELYARQGDLSQMTMFADLDATAAWAAANHGDAARLAVTGFCRGGRNTWLYAAHNPALKAAAAWYGPMASPTSAIQPHNPADVADQLKCPLLGLYGAQDSGIRVSDVQTAAELAKAAGKIVDIVVYPDAGHGFHADYRPSYVAADAADGWARMLAWFRKYGV